MPIFSADTWFLSNRYIARRENNAFSSGNLSTGTDIATNFDLLKFITKNEYPKGGLSPER